MRLFSLSQMKGGWFAGDFQDSVLRIREAECAVKKYRAGDKNPLHHHKLATEVTVIVSGEARMGAHYVGEGDIVLVEPNEASDFEALTDCALVTFKTPSVPSDKYDGWA